MDKAIELGQNYAVINYRQSCPMMQIECLIDIVLGCLPVVIYRIAADRVGEKRASIEKRECNKMTKD